MGLYEFHLRISLERHVFLASQLCDSLKNVLLLRCTRAMIKPAKYLRKTRVCISAHIREPFVDRNEAMLIYCDVPYSI